MGLGHVIRKSKHLFVHSYYARNKIKLKSGLQECDLPPISVIEHPKEPCTIELDRSASSETFTIGCFGWIGKYKRINSIIEAYESFVPLSSNSASCRTSSLQGSCPIQDSLIHAALASQLGVDDKIEFPGFFNHEQFLQELGE